MKNPRVLTMLSAGFAIAAVAAAAAVPALPMRAVAADDPAGSKAAIAREPAFCAVTGEAIPDATQAAAKAQVNGRTYYLCCAGCEPSFKKNPAKYARLSDLRADLRAAQSKVEALKTEIERIEKAAPAAAVSSAPASVTGATPAGEVFCAVRGSAIPSAAKAAGKAAFNGKTYYFCCAGCEEAFTKEPARFAAEADKRGAAAAAATPAAP